MISLVMMQKVPNGGVLYSRHVGGEQTHVVVAGGVLSDVDVELFRAHPDVLLGVQ